MRDNCACAMTGEADKVVALLKGQGRMVFRCQLLLLGSLMLKPNAGA